MRYLPEKEKLLLIFISLAIVFSIAVVMYFQPPFFQQWMVRLENSTYDRAVRRYHKPLSPHPSIAIIDIDDKSLAEEGRWPWSRAKMAQLAFELERLGASVIAFDMVFSEPEENPVDQILHKVDDPALIEELKEIRSNFATIPLFTEALKKGQNILGFALASNGKEVGMLPPPLLILSKGAAEKTLIPAMNGYIGNLPPFQEAATGGGFINAMVDADGILRFSPLLLREEERVYPSLGLEAARLFLNLPFSGILTSLSGDNQLIQAIQLGTLTIPTDPWGRLLIPFRGPPYSFPYLSATDLLHGKIQEEAVRGKLLFIGLSATASADFFATAISPVFPGAELQASIASGIIDHYLPAKPAWGRGAAIGLVLVLGTLAAFTFPFISQVLAFVLACVVILILQGINYWLWTRHAVVLSFFFPTPTLATVFIVDLISVSIADMRHKKEIKRIFGHYVPSETLEQLILKKGKWTVTGESRELTVLFADIWNFRNLSKTFSAKELREFLHLYFTEMNRAIFEEKGLIDKYVRDQIIAFWGAPLEEPEHAKRAVLAALAMQRCLPDLNRKLKELGKPEIQIGIGINTGLLHIGDMGSQFQRAYTAIGYPADLALHLKELTKEHSVPILVGHTTWEKTHEAFTYRKIGKTQLEGEEEIYALLEEKSHVS